MPVLIVSREDLGPRRLLQEAFDSPVVIRDYDPELERVLDAFQADRDCTALLFVEADERPEIEVAERIAGDHDEGLVERLFGKLPPSLPCPRATPPPSKRIWTPWASPAPK